MKEKTKIEKMLKGISVRNRDGKQLTIAINGYTLHYSYNSLIIAVNDKTNKYYIGQNAFYSTTTAKFRNAMLGEQRKETEKKLKSGEYTQLNV